MSEYLWLSETFFSVNPLSLVMRNNFVTLLYLKSFHFCMWLMKLNRKYSSVFMLFRCFPLMVGVFSLVLVTGPNLISLNRLVAFQ